MQSSSDYKLVPPEAFVGGRDCDGTPIYVGRSFHRDDELPAKVIPSKGCAYVCWRGKEIKKREYEVLVGDDYKWVTSYGGSVPRNAIHGGYTTHGERLYIGRVAYRNSLTIGKIHPSHGCLYIPFAGRELNFHSYEVLTGKADRYVCGAPFKKVSETCYVRVDKWESCYAPIIELHLSIKIKINF